MVSVKPFNYLTLFNKRFALTGAKIHLIKKTSFNYLIYSIDSNLAQYINKVDEIMPKDKLLIALLFTIITIGGFLFFQSAEMSLATGQVVSLCLGALAWVTLFIYPEQSNSKHPAKSAHSINQSTNTDTASLSSSMTNLFNTIQTELNGQIVAIEAELNQVKSLMVNAIDDLVDSFVSLEATTRIGQNLISRMISSETNNRDELNPFRDRQMKSQTLLNETSELLKKLIKDTKQNKTATASLTSLEKISDNAASKTLAELQKNGDLLHKETKEVSYKVADMIDENKAIILMVADEMATTNAQVAEDVQIAIKSLQFQDMTTQLITQCTERLEMMQKMLSSIESLGQTLGNSQTPEQSMQEWQTKLVAAHHALKQAGNMRMKQFNVDPGSVELFS